MVELSPDAVRSRVVAGNRLCAGGPDVTVVERRSGEDGAPVALRVYEGPRAAVTLVYAHGGGWVTGDLDYADEFCRFLAAEAAVRVVSVGYRLAPEHPFPAPVDDFAAAWTWATGRYGGPAALAGDSAGGNLAAALANRLTRPGTGVPVAPEFLLLLYPVLGLPDRTASYRTMADAFPTGAADMRWFFDHYAPAEVRTKAPADLVPLHEPDLSQHPRTHLVLAAHDPLHDEGAAYAARLSQSGVPLTVVVHPDLCHGFLRFTAASAAARAARSGAVAAVRRLTEPAMKSLPLA